MNNTRHITMTGSLTRKRWHAALWVFGAAALVYPARTLRPHGETL